MASPSSTKYQLLPHCATHAEGLIIVATCDGASSVGQIGNEVARILTKTFPDKVRMCCLSAVAAGSKTHIDIFRKARAVIAINGCQLMCASRVLREKGIVPTYEIVVAKEGVDKLPTLDFDEEDVRRIANKISTEFLQKFQQ
ncbi:MAG: putative zinc-binding protein [Infirmifilum sp.]